MPTTPNTSLGRKRIHTLIPLIIAAGVWCAPMTAACAQSTPPTQTFRPPTVPTGTSAAWNVTRVDLARAYLELERSARAHPDAPGEQTASVNRAFDRAAGAFFTGDFSSATRVLHEQTAVLDGESSDADLALARSIRVEIDPPVLPVGERFDVQLKLSRMYPTPPRASGAPLEVVVEVVGEAQTVLASRTITISGGDDRFNLALPLSIQSDRVGRTSIMVRRAGKDDGARVIQAGFMTFVKAQLELTREDLLARLEKVDRAPRLDFARGIFTQRARLLSDRPPTTISETFALDQAVLERELTFEIREIEALRDPYKASLSGDRWSAFELGEAFVPMRLFAPKRAGATDAAPTSPRPLVIALHGAGGDEHMFMDGLGAGLLKDLASAKGFVVASPRLSLLGGGPGEVFDALLEGIERQTPIDRSRVYVIGHSMGGGIATVWAKLRPDKIAAVCTFASVGRLAGGAQIPPTLVNAGAIDGLVSAASIKQDADTAKQQESPVEFRSYDHLGHTLVVARALPESIDWLLAKRLKP